jgi:hypothetical protein
VTEGYCRARWEVVAGVSEVPLGGSTVLTGRYALGEVRITASPSRIGDIVAAARMLTQFEQRDLRRSC